MKIFQPMLLIIFVIAGASWFSHTKVSEKTKTLQLPKINNTYPADNLTNEKIQGKAVEARKFTQKKKYNTSICFLIDMSLPSGQKRFFIYDLKNDSVKISALVAHGNCFEYWLEGRRYSNQVGSGCTSLGKYRIGSSYTGKWGYSYKLHGLDSSNNKAFERTVVLHAHSCVPDEVVADEICQSNGCPTVSPAFLQQIKNIINNSGKPVLLWIYD